MAFYDHIARKWHSLTGSRGGRLKEAVLNDLVLQHLPGVSDLAILELGAGNGYFAPLMLRHFSGQVPSRLVITDQSGELLKLAQRSFKVPGAEYSITDVRRDFPFETAVFDLLLASMVFNEVPTTGFRHALKECRRVLRPGGRLVATVTHPRFIASLARREQLKRDRKGRLTMPGSGGLRLPVVNRRVEDYLKEFRAAGFDCRTEDVHATPSVLKAKPGLRAAGKVPLALLLDCTLDRNRGLRFGSSPGTASELKMLAAALRANL